MKALTVVLSLSAGMAVAQQDTGPLPAQFNVRDVVATDTLKIRAEPSAQAPILGQYGPYALNIEVLEVTPDGRWGKVGLPEGNGWIAMRYVERQSVEPFSLPRPVSCFGTEPFWGLNMTVRGDEFTSPDIGRTDLNLLTEDIAPNGFLVTFEEGPTLNHTLIVQRGQCGDGMTDRAFGFRATLFTAAPDGNDVRHGCCSLDGNQ